MQSTKQIEGSDMSDKGDKLSNYLTMTGHICSDINQGAITAILPFLVVDGGYSYLNVTMLVFASNIASAIIQPLFGSLSDRHPSPWFMALGVFLAGLGMAGIGYVEGYGWVVASAMLSGIGVAMFHPEGGRLANLAAGTHKGTGMSIFAVGGNIGFFIGPILCAVLLSTFGLHGTIVFLIPSTICAVVLLAFNRRFMALGTAAANTSGNAEARERCGLFAMLMGVLSLRAIAVNGLLAFIPLFLIGVLDQSTAFGSLVISVYSIAAALGTLASGVTAERFGAHRLMIVCTAVATLGVVAFAFNDNIGIALGLTMLLAISSSLYYPSSVALGMDYIPQHLGMAAGLTYGVAICIGGIAEPFLGIAGDVVGLVPVMLILAASMLVAVVLAFVLRHLDKAHV